MQIDAQSSTDSFVEVWAMTKRTKRVFKTWGEAVEWARKRSFRSKKEVVLVGVGAKARITVTAAPKA